MKLEEIERSWSEDCRIDDTKLATEAARVPVLHSKYYAILIRESFELTRMEEELNVLIKNKHLYYTYVLTDAELSSMGWKRIDFKPLRNDLEKYMSADSDLAKAKLKYSLQDEKVSFVKSILNTINSRGYLIRSMIDWKKFEAGG